MKPLSAFLAFLIAMLSPLAPAGALCRSYPTDDGTGRTDYGFQLVVVGRDEAVKPEIEIGGDRKIIAQPGERYTLRVYNPLPVRAAVNLTIDGLNTIDGKPCGIADGSRWLIEPRSWITIRGWQVNGAESRRFYFTDAKKSYAAWRGAKLHKELMANCGVIGAAFFWNREELVSWQQAQVARRCENAAMDESLSLADRMGSSAPAAAKKAGTGMGERETHVVRSVEFNADAGMFDPQDALVLYYGFAAPERPNPFPALTFAPEMP